MVQSAYDHLVPPLKAIDVLMLSGLGLSAKFFYPAVPCSGPPDDFEYGVMDVRAIHTILAADPTWADRAGIIWMPGSEQQRGALATTYSAWLSNSLQPALGGPWCPNPDKSARGQVIKEQWQQINRGYFKPDYAQMMRDLEAVVVNNVGGNEPDARNRDELSPYELRAWYKLFAECGSFDTTAFDFSSDSLGFNKRAAARILRAELGQGTHLKTRHKSLEYEGNDGHTLADVLENERATKAEDDSAVRELRDFRDVRDLAAAHPLLDKLAESAEHDPDHARALGQLFDRLVPILDGHDDPAMRAAVVYEFGAWNQGGHGAWSRNEVGASYGVSARQIEKRSLQAIEIVARVRAA